MYLRLMDMVRGSWMRWCQLIRCLRIMVVRCFKMTGDNDVDVLSDLEDVEILDQNQHGWSY